MEDYQLITWSPYDDLKSRVNNSVGKLVYKTSAIKKQKAKDANSEKKKKTPVSILENTKRKTETITNCVSGRHDSSYSTGHKRSIVTGISTR